MDIDMNVDIDLGDLIMQSFYQGKGKATEIILDILLSCHTPKDFAQQLALATDNQRANTYYLEKVIEALKKEAEVHEAT